MSKFTGVIKTTAKVASKLPFLNLILRSSVVITTVLGCPKKDAISLINSIDAPESSSQNGDPKEALRLTINADCSTMVNEDQDYPPCLPNITQAEKAEASWSFGPRHTCLWMSIEPSTGLVSGQPNNSNVGSCLLEIKAQDELNGFNFYELNILVNNISPILTIGETQPIDEDSINNILLNDTGVQSSDEGLGQYSLLESSDPKCSDHAEKLEINPQNGAVTFTPTLHYFGTCNINIAFDDGQLNGIVNLEVSQSVLPINDTPVLMATCPSSVDEDHEYNCLPTLYDPDTMDLQTWSFNENHTCGAWLSLDPSTGVLQGTPRNGDTGLCIVSIKANDGTVDSSSITFNLTVNAVNDPPIITLSCPSEINQEEHFQCQLSAFDEEGAAVTWSTAFTNTCQWLNLNPTTGLLDGTPNDDQVGNCQVSFNVWDGANLSNTQTLQLTINNLTPTLSIAAPNPIPENAPLLLVQTDANVQANEEGFGTYSITSAPFNDCSAHADTLTIDANTGAIHFKPEEYFNGTCQIAVSFDDGNSAGIITDEFTMTVNPGPSPCRYLSYEGFDYTTNSPLHGLLGGKGWGEEWKVQNSVTTIPGIQIKGSSSLSYLDLRGVGNYLEGGDNYLGLGRLLDTRNTSPLADYLMDGAIGKPGKTLYLSVILNKKTNDDSHLTFTLHNNNVSWASVTGQRLTFGFKGSESKIGATRYWTIIKDSEAPDFGTYRIASSMTPTLVVARFQWALDGSTTIDFFVNPTPIAGEEPTNSDFSISYPQTNPSSTAPTFKFKALAFYLGEGPSKGQIDEIRMIDTFRCATPDSGSSIISEPQPIITASKISGQRPLTVDFNANQSINGTLNIVQYDWDLGDGSAPVTNQESTTHTFNSLGEIPVTLTLTDSSGQKHYATQKILVLDENNQYPCRTSVSVRNKPTCGNNDGSLEVMKLNSISHRLIKKSNGQEMPQTGSYFNSLPPGEYSYTAWNANGCIDERTLYFNQDSSTCPNYQEDTCSMDLGMNIEGVSYYDQGRMFKDFMKSSGEWISFNTLNNGIWSTNKVNQIPADNNGYPLKLPYTVGGDPQGMRLILSADGHIPADDYVILYDGSGQIQLSSGPTNVVYSPNRITFTMPPTYTGNFYANISSSTEGNYIRNIRVLKLADEVSYDPSHPFNPQFLARLQGFKAIRFLLWTDLNKNFTPLNFNTDRKPRDYYTQSAYRGVAFEYFTLLAKELNVDIWINVHHLASESYVSDMANFFHNELQGTSNKIYLEYSNEVWNYSFAQAGWVDANSPKNLSRGQKYVEKALKVFKIWETAFGADKAKLKRVFNVHSHDTTYVRDVLAFAPPESYDYVAPDWYFYASGACQDQLILDGANATGAQVVACMREYFDSVMPTFKQNFMTAELYGKEVINYEGGQAIMALGYSQTYQQAYYDAQITNDMFNLYDYALSKMRQLGSKLPFAFQLSGKRQSVWGSWGALESIYQAGPFYETAPKYEALIRNIPANRPECQ